MEKKERVAKAVECRDGSKRYLPKMKGSFCEICFGWDPYTLDRHHIEPVINRKAIGHVRENGDVIVVCANCHARCHRMYGGVSRRKYVGPTTKDGLILALRTDMKKYMRPNPYLPKGRSNGRDNYYLVSDKIVRQIKNEYANGEGSIRQIAEKHNMPHSTVHNLIHRKKRSYFRPSQIKTILRKCESGISHSDIAKEYGVSEKTIFRISTGKTYTNMTTNPERRYF